MKKHILKQIRKYLKQTEYYLTRNEEKCKKIYKLTPTDTIKDSSYLEILKESIDDEELTNIALTGPYGSGKSSIIKAFEKYYSYRDDYKFLNISLATFKDNLKKTEEKNEMSLPEYEQIEKSILQQMFYKVEQKSIPNSRFKRIKTTKNTTFKTSMILLWGASIIELFSPHTFIYHFYNKFDLTFLFTGVFTIGSIYFVDLLLKRTSNIKLEKLSLQSPEINLSNNDSDISILNKHIDEIIYFFDETDYNIVVIEDLDRFNNAEIFTKLREINTLINNRKGKAPITFLYAIKDDMFKDKDRTKFFDFLIPVIPIINSSNSFNLLKGIFEENNLIEHVDKQFLKEISL